LIFDEYSGCKLAENFDEKNSIDTEELSVFAARYFNEKAVMPLLLDET
jgi:hypothetical protein